LCDTPLSSARTRLGIGTNLEKAWSPSFDAGGQVRAGAWVAEITGTLDLAGWPTEIRMIVRKERPIRARSCGSPGGHRFTFATSTKGGKLADSNCASGDSGTRRGHYLK
jgi:hypothetical protein